MTLIVFDCDGAPVDSRHAFTALPTPDNGRELGLGRLGTGADVCDMAYALQKAVQIG